MPLIDLPPRVYRASEYYDAGNGWRWVADLPIQSDPFG